MKLSTMLVPLLTALTVSARIYNPTVPLNFTIGNDGPQAAATLGYSSQHTALFVSNFDKSVAFYRDILGMRTVFEIKWDTYKISYLTYSGGGGDEAVHETGAQLFGKQTKLKGGFELQWYKGAKKPRPELAGSISHIGISVPDMASAVARLQAANVKFLKKPGQAPSNDLGQYYGFPKGEFPTWFKQLIPLNYAFVLDPDGYMIELVRQENAAPPPPSAKAR